MCLAIPAQIHCLPNESEQLAVVDIMGVRRRVNIGLLMDDPPILGDWVLIHVGFALSKISEKQANEQFEMLSMLGEATAAQDEFEGYQFGEGA